MNKTMSENKLYTLSELMDGGVDGLHITKVLIPKIQRSYAHGRKEEKQVREAILNEMFDAMRDGKDAEFGFIYGSINNGVFELLDGQQRITTLYLLYAYVYIRERGGVPDWMRGRFAYETRTSSTDFVNKLASLANFGINNASPSKYLNSMLWFTSAYKVDPTVTAMLTMLDSIHEKYAEYGCSDLSGHLEHLKFYVLRLDKFGLTEELYVKMNARGLPLTPFENFKADLVGYYKPKEKDVRNEALNDWLNFATRLDTVWLDLFWSKEDQTDKDFNNKFFRFFYRYCAVMVYLRLKGQNDARSFLGDKDADLSFFEKKSEEQERTDARYAGFAYYKKLLDNGIDIKRDTTKILDTLLEDKDVIYSQLTSQWNDKCQPFCDESSYKRKDAVIFAAVILFILNYETFNETNFRRWMRVVWNIVENTNIDGVVPQINTVRNLYDILENDKSNGDIYLTLARSFSGNKPQAIVEEARKAEMIVSDNEFEQLFMSLESHPFFRGFIDVVVSNSSYQVVENRIRLMAQAFDGDGIAPGFRKDGHLLLRAVISSIKKWIGGLENLPVTEKADSDAHLKNLLRRPEVKVMLQSLLDKAHSAEDFAGLLRRQIDDRDFTGFECDYIQPGLMDKAYERLCTDAKLYDWIYEHCDSSKCVVIKQRDGRLKVRVPRKWYDKIYIDNDRRSIVPRIVRRHGFEYVDVHQTETLSCVGDYYGDVVEIMKNFGDYVLSIVFSYNDNVEYWISRKSLKQEKIVLSQWSKALVSDDKRWMQINASSLGRAASMVNRLEREILALPKI